MKKINLIIPLAGLMIAGSAVTGMAALASADTTTAPSTTTSGVQHVKPTAMGTITAINGTTITLDDKMASTTYTVDVTNATFTARAKPTTAGAKPTETTTTLANLKVGDMIGVQGTLSGTSITATSVMSGMGGMRGHGGPGMMGGNHGVRGTVSAVSGSTLTVTGQNGTTYTVDASGATASKVQTISVSDITVGDSVDVGGTVTGTSVTAKNILDGMPKPTQSK